MISRRSILSAAPWAAFFMARPAKAHEWFSGYRDPVFDWACCDGDDCDVVPLPEKSIRVEREGYRVTMTAEEARRLNPGTELPVDGVVTWDRVILSPTGQYAACPFRLRRDKETAGLRCLFVPPNS